MGTPSGLRTPHWASPLQASAALSNVLHWGPKPLTTVDPWGTLKSHPSHSMW
jgi:hypothetical protein